MSRIFQVFTGFCYWDATRVHPTLASTEGLYAPDIKFAEAPDYVREGWGFDPSAEGDARFIEPTPPPGWRYDRDTGTFYPDSGYIPPETETEDMQAALGLLGVTPEEG